MSDNQAGNNNELDQEVQDDPVIQGHSALNDPNLSGDTASSWTGTGGPDPGGMAGPADLDDQGNTSGASGNAGGSPS